MGETEDLDNGEWSERASYEEVHFLLTSIFLLLEHPDYGRRREAWLKKRASLLSDVGWTESEFYGEMYRRQRTKRISDIRFTAT